MIAQPTLEQQITTIKKDVLTGVLNAKTQKPTDEQIMSVTNHQTMMLQHIAGACFNIEMFLPFMKGRSKQQIGMILNQMKKAVGIVKFENGFTDGKDDAYLDLEDLTNDVLRKFTRAIFEEKDGQFIDSIKYFKSL